MVAGVSRTDSAAPGADEFVYEVPVEMDRSYKAIQDGNLGAFFSNLTVGNLKRLYYDLETRTKTADYYAPLYTNSEALFASLQVHEDDGVISLNPEQRAYIEEAIILSNNEGPALTAEQDEILGKILTGQAISKEEALKAYSYLLGLRDKVIPPEYQPENVSASLQTVKDRYDNVLDSIPQKSRAWTGDQ